ncbi:MAG TPA: chemotaxis protein CheA [Sphingobium sp.]
MDELLTQFLIEGRDLVADAHGALRALQGDPADARTIDALFRATHTLKGSVALFAMAPAEELLHAAEALLVQARRNGTAISERERSALVSVIDQIDRWTDAMEADGRLPDGAAALSRQLVQTLIEEEEATSVEDAAPAAWLAAMTARPQFAGRLPALGGTAFRYTPDPECFFRGEDPLGTVAAVPGLLAFVIMPNDAWPDMDEMDPFRCVCHVEGVSTADMDSVRAAFRLVPDQIALHPLDADTATRMEDGQGKRAATALLRVEGAKLDRLARQSGELAIAVNGLDGLAARAEPVDRELAADIRRTQTAIERASGALRASVAEVRLISLAPALRRLPRLARDVAATLGKEVRFSITGDETEVDKQIADGLFEPLLHLVRNAIDHGIEAPTERAATGKPGQGEVTLSIAPHGDRLLVTLRDDGRGIDPDLVRRSAIDKGLIDAEGAAALSDAKALRLIFAPGFSTTGQVSQVSGRGVGMDAVQSAIERLQGTVEIDSLTGSGTTIRIALPLNAITTRLLTISVGGQVYGLRLDQIAETLRMETQAIQAVGQGEACVVRGRTVPVIDLATLLGHPRARADMERLILTDVTGERIALRVDAWGERIDAMVRERSGLLSAIPAIGGTAVLGDGGVLLVLDLQELAA